jgi:uncharacterized protein YbjT (DUF2867 family)
MRQGGLVTIFGGSGFLGKYVAQHVLAAGWRLRVAERNIRNAQHIRPLGNLGQVQFTAADVTKADSVVRAVHGADAVINLVGILDGNFEAVHVAGARNVAQAAADAGCTALVHVSAIGADTNSPSRYGRSKADGEAAVRDVFPQATIIRPSIIFGREDQFVNRFAGLIALLKVVPVIGGSAKFQPVYVDDVAKAIAASITNPAEYQCRTFELGGPEVVSMAELNKRIAMHLDRDVAFVPVPDSVSRVMAKATGWLPGAPITSDQWAMLQSDNVVADNMPGLDSFGITPTPMSAVVDDYLVRYRKHGRFGIKAHPI